MDCTLLHNTTHHCAPLCHYTMQLEALQRASGQCLATRKRITMLHSALAHCSTILQPGLPCLLIPRTSTQLRFGPITAGCLVPPSSVAMHCGTASAPVLLLVVVVVVVVLAVIWDLVLERSQYSIDQSLETGGTNQRHVSELPLEVHTRY